jgi:predicted nucleic acid-binding protein
MARFVEPKERVYIVKDEADNRIMECAMAAKAEVVVTGDKGLLGLGELGGIRVISLREYLKGDEKG